MERRQFLITLAAGGLTLIAAGKKALAEDQRPEGRIEDLESFFPERIRAQDIQITIEHNHGHVLALKDSDLRDYRNRSYDIHGMATHSHMVYLSRGHFMRMARGRTVRVVSSNNYGHHHVILLRKRMGPYDEPVPQN